MSEDYNWQHSKLQLLSKILTTSISTVQLIHLWKEYLYEFIGEGSTFKQKLSVLVIVQMCEISVTGKRLPQLSIVHCMNVYFRRQVCKPVIW